jgi:hypothetical protein
LRACHSFNSQQRPSTIGSTRDQAPPPPGSLPQSTSAMTSTCALCNIPESRLGLFAPPLKRCSRCLTTFYCSHVHQLLHWRVHQSECILNYSPDGQALYGDRVSDDYIHSDTGDDLPPPTGDLFSLVFLNMARFKRRLQRALQVDESEKRQEVLRVTYYVNAFMEQQLALEDRDARGALIALAKRLSVYEPERADRLMRRLDIVWPSICRLLGWNNCWTLFSHRRTTQGVR